MFYLFFLQFDLKKLLPENLFGGQVLERTPAALSLIFLVGVTLLVLLLLLSLIRNLRPQFAFERDLPKEVKRRLGTTIANRSLRIWQIGFVLMTFLVFGFHVYWGAFARNDNQDFQDLMSRDLRYRRASSSQLRGWLFDRSGKLGSALAYYKKGDNGNIVRTYGLDRELSHLLGTELGSPGIERTIYKQTVEPLPEAWEVLTTIKKPDEGQRDVRITIDRDLQVFAAEQLKGRNGAIVVLNPQTGDILAMYSNPTFALSEIKSIDDMYRLERDKMNKPLLSRATREFYLPGSTFKTFTMISSFRAGKQSLTLPATPECYVPFRGSKAICDFGGGCHMCSPNLPLEPAFMISSNQYFSQLANTLGRQQMGETAGLLGIAAVDSPKKVGRQGYFGDIWNASNKRLATSIAPARSTLVTGKEITLFDFGLQGMGQGMLAMTPFQMALIAAVPANMQGNLMKPKIEADIPPQVFSQVLSAQQAAETRRIMSTVTQEGGTAARPFQELTGLNIMVGGKTGSAERKYIEYDKEGNPKLSKKCLRKVEGQCAQYETLKVQYTDSWFISIAPLENPQVAIAVVVEKAGQGSKAAAPIAVQMIKKARDLGLLGEQYKPQTVKEQPAQTKAPARKRR